MPNVRTQITLPVDLKEWADSQSLAQHISLAEVVRLALLHEKEKQDTLSANRKEVAAQIFGTSDRSLGPEWKDRKAVSAWVRSVREESER